MCGKFFAYNNGNEYKVGTEVGVKLEVVRNVAVTFGFNKDFVNNEDSMVINLSFQQDTSKKSFKEKAFVNTLQRDLNIVYDKKIVKTTKTLDTIISS
jgi:hypothetical protein